MLVGSGGVDMRQFVAVAGMDFVLGKFYSMFKTYTGCIVGLLESQTVTVKSLHCKFKSLPLYAMVRRTTRLIRSTHGAS